MCFQLADGCGYGLLNNIEDYNRGGLCIAGDLLLPSTAEVRVLDSAIWWQEEPPVTCCDYGLEYMSLPLAGRLVELDG